MKVKCNVLIGKAGALTNTAEAEASAEREAKVQNFHHQLNFFAAPASRSLSKLLLN